MEGFYCNRLKRNILILGYSGGGEVNFKNFEKEALRFSYDSGFPIESICINEIHESNRYKQNKFIYSTVENQKKINDYFAVENFYSWVK